MTLPLGHASIAAIKVNAGVWGSSQPVACGAGDGFEFDSESLKASSSRIKSEGNYGNAYRRAGAFGALKVGGNIPLDLYYRCASWRLAALAMGGAAVTSLGGGANRHDLTLINNHAGKNATLAIPFQTGGGVVEGVKEIPHLKVDGLSLEWSREGAGKLTADIIGFDDYFNIGSPSVAFVVASVAVATGAQTVLAAALAEFTPSPLTYTKAGTVTAINVTIVYVDRLNVQRSVTFIETDFVSNLWTGLDYARRVISVTNNSFTGTGNISVGISNGVNNASTVSAITTAAERDKVLFSQLRFYANAQGGADFVAADEYFLESFKLALKIGFDQRVTTQFQYRTDEPATGAQARPELTFSLNYSSLTTQNKNKFFDMVAKNQIKAKLVFTGPTVPASSPAVAQSLTLFLNAIQFDDGEGQVGGPGVIGFEQNGEAQQALAVPTGFPAGADEPLMIQLVNNLATAII